MSGFRKYESYSFTGQWARCLREISITLQTVRTNAPLSYRKCQRNSNNQNTTTMTCWKGYQYSYSMTQHQSLSYDSVPKQPSAYTEPRHHSIPDKTKNNHCVLPPTSFYYLTSTLTETSEPLIATTILTARRQSSRKSGCLS